MRYSLALPLLLAAGCTVPPPVTPLAPTQFTSSLSPTLVVQSAVQTLAARGFTVTTADATGGVVVAARAFRERDPATVKALLHCRWPDNAIGWAMTSGRLTITVAARAADEGSVVTITGTPDIGSADDCTSNGSTEAAIAKAITTP